jgi:hypothetical protein
MSWIAQDWAETTPVADPYERIILMVMAHRADPDGEGVYLSSASIARRATCDAQTVERRLRALKARGVIAEGEQRRAAHIPKNRRPKVYDLMIPLSDFSSRQLAEVQRFREEHGRPPLTGEMRPDLPEPGRSRKARSDLGVRKGPRRDAADDEQPIVHEDRTPDAGGDLTSDDLLGGLVDPPASAPGGSSRYLLGGLVDTSRGVYKTPNTFRSRPSPKPGGGGEQRAQAAASGQPSQSSSSSKPPLVFDLHDPSTWLCKMHAATAPSPGEWQEPCGPCGRVRKSAERRLELERQQQAHAGQEQASRAAACRRRGWCDGNGNVQEARGVVLVPFTACDHETPPELVVARVRAAEAQHEPASTRPDGRQPLTDERRAQLHAMAARRPAGAAR